MNYSDQVLIQNHYYLGMRNTAPSHALTGDVVVIHILVNDIWSNWAYNSHVAEYQNTANQMASTLMYEAAKSGQKLIVRSAFCQVTLPIFADETGGWIPTAFACMGFPNAAAMQNYYERQYHCTEAPIIFAINRPMRSFASVNNTKSFFRQDEFSAVFRHTSGMFESRVLLHELLHQFGAPDYYYPQVTVNAAYRYFPDSIMFMNGNEIDDLTRCLIGWTNELTPRAMAFLRETACVNDAMIIQAKMQGV